jgi:hypothetical protein
LELDDGPQDMRVGGGAIGGKRAVAVLHAAAMVCGCARVSPDAALAVADRYYAALAASDFAGACGLMTGSQRNSFEGGNCAEVMRFLLETDGAPGQRALQPRGVRIAATGDRHRFELRYQVAYRNGPRVDILSIVGTAGSPDTFRIDGIARQEVLVVD